MTRTLSRQIHTPIYFATLGYLATISVVFALFSGTASAQKLSGTMTYAPPEKITPANTNHDFGKHAVTRLVDWNDDGMLDLLIGGGDGNLWLSLNQGNAAFGPVMPVENNGTALQLGNQLTTACFVDMTGDDLADLVVAHSNNQASLLVNIGSASQPRFDTPKPLVHKDGTPVELPQGCGGRIDVGDYNGDGTNDLVAGHFSGPITCYSNTGTPINPRFESGQPLSIRNEAKNYSYNVHPTLFDLNQDGVVDVAYGMNWGNVGFLMATASESNPVDSSIPIITNDLTPILSTGQSIDLREIAGDDATPTFGDIDGDGTIDMISGGRKGQLFLLRGVPIAKSQDRIDAIMREHTSDLGTALSNDEKLRTELIGLHHSMYRLCQSFLTSPASRDAAGDWYVKHIDQNAKWLKRTHHDIKAQPYVPSLAYQTWTILMLLHQGDPDAVDHRRFVADTIGFEGRLKDILLEFGTLIIENGKATANQQQTLYSYLKQIPAPLLGDRSVNAITEVITIGEYIGPRLDVLHAGGVNIFANDSGKPKSSENPFPKDFDGCDNDYFGVVLAHELNHRVDATRFVAVPKYNQKYWDHMRKICGDDVKFLAPSGIGVDWDATKKHFRDQQLWDGNDARWNEDWANYWLTGPGKSQTKNVCRNETTYTPPRYGIPFFLETRQESIASLANQYFTDSIHMFQFAMDRYRRGSRGCLDEWLLMADVYSMDQPHTYLYRHRNGTVDLARIEVPLKRNAQGHITTIKIAGKVYDFELDEKGLVETVSVRGEPANQ